MPYLELVGGAGDRWELVAGTPFTIGSSRRADLSLKGQGISFTHAVIEPAEGGLRLVAKPSAGGTWVNGEQVERARPRPLTPGDLLRFGDVEARFLAEEPAASGAAPGVSAMPHPIGRPAPDPSSAAGPADLLAAAAALPPGEALALLREEVARLAEALQRAEAAQESQRGLLAAAEEARASAEGRVSELEGRLAREAAANEALREEVRALEPTRSS